MSSADHATEVTRGDRFEFGANWARFLKTLSNERIDAATASLTIRLKLKDLVGRSFLDAGSGSGLFSLAAHRLGAEVTSFDFDPHSVTCTAFLKERYACKNPAWKIMPGSVLDRNFLESLGIFDVVYSWGVLHHTGKMWGAIENVAGRVNTNGMLFIAIYNDQRAISRYWKFVKHAYNRGALWRALVTAWHLPYLALRYLARMLKGQKLERGMSLWHDYIDWLGGYPFEVARPEDIFSFLHDRGFILETLVTCGGRQGCNEFVFRRT